MTPKKAKNLILENPYVLDHTVVISVDEIEKIIDSVPHILTFEELIAAAKRRFPQYGHKYWVEIDNSISFSKKRKHASQRSTGVKAPRRLAFIGMLLMIVLFFAFVPVGRTMAMRMYGYIVDIFENTLDIKPIDPPKTSSSAEEGEQVISQRIRYSNPEDFTQKTGYIPFVPNGDAFELVEIWGEYDPDLGQYVMSVYKDPQGFSIWISEEWFTGQSMGSGTDAEEYTLIPIRDGYILYSSISETDGYFGGTAAMQDSILFVGAEKGVDLNQLMNALR